MYHTLSEKEFSCDNTSVIGDFERTMIFDVETNGLPRKGADIVEQPYILQLSFIVTNVYFNKEIIHETILESNYYISIDSKIAIPTKIVKLTGITKEKCKTIGVPITDVLYEFYTEYMRAQRIVSHNIEFDSKMILFEIERNYHKLVSMGCPTPYAVFNPLFNKMNNKKIYCTMTNGREFTNIMVIFKDKNPLNIENINIQKSHTYKKNPKLIELYTYFYPERSQPIGLHDSMVDTRVCMECYIKMCSFLLTNKNTNILVTV